MFDDLIGFDGEIRRKLRNMRLGCSTLSFHHCLDRCGFSLSFIFSQHRIHQVWQTAPIIQHNVLWEQLRFLSLSVPHGQLMYA